MSLLQKLRHALLGRPQPAVTRLDPPDNTALRIDELPAFTLATADLMRYDPQVRIGLGARNGLLMAAQVDVTAESDRGGAWVQHQWDSLWGAAAYQLLRAKLYGFLPFEVVYRQAKSCQFAGLIEVERLIDHHAQDTRLLTQGDKIVGFSYDVAMSDFPDALRGTGGGGARGRGGEGESGRNSDSAFSPSPTPPLSPSSAFHSETRNIFAPQALVCTFDADGTSPYGCALLARAYPAWYEKWMPGGAKRTLRLRMIKDAYIGDIFWYPPDRRFELMNGNEISFKELAKEIIESRHSGGALTLPLIRDATGQKLVDYTPPQGVAGYTQIFRWKQDLDLEIWKALEVPPEIIQAQNSGSGYSGRWIPFAVALSAVHQELAELLRCIDRDILRPIAEVNFGRHTQYEIRPRSLVETYSAMFGKEQAPRA
jgi:hypothetical protein